MSLKQGCLAAFILGLILAQTTARADDARPLSGSVRDGDNRAVAQEEVLIEQVGSYLTSNSGEFEFPVPDPHRHDPASIRFHVKNWVVVKPCELQNGRAYLEGAASFDITVYRLSDKRLLDVTQGLIYIPCVVQEMVSNFRLTRHPPARSKTSTVPESPTSRQDKTRIMSVGWSSSFREASDDADPLGRNEFTLKKAEEMGFSARELVSALNEWAKTPGDQYHRGLAALYEGRYPEAASLIADSIHSAGTAPVGHYVALARAEYEQGHLEAAKSALLKALELHPTDAIIKADLDLASGAPAESIPPRPNGETELPPPQGSAGGGAHPVQTTPNILIVIIFTLAGIVALSLLLYYVYRLLVRVLEEEFNRRIESPPLRLEPASEHRQADPRKVAVAVFILHSLYSTFRSVGGRPPEQVERMIQQVRETQERPSAGMGA